MKKTGETELGKPCANCGSTAPRKFCPDCGQPTKSPRRPMHQMGFELLDGLFFSPDSKLLRTLRLLLTKPGELTRQYLAGARHSQLPPVRLYLVLSILIFLFAPPISMRQPHELELVTASEPDEQGHRQYQWNMLLPSDTRPPGSWAPRRTRTALERLASIDDPHVLHDVVQRRTGSVVPNSLLLMIPVTAALLALAYFKERRPFIDFLIFVLHYQSMLLTWILIASAMFKICHWFGLAEGRQLFINSVIVWSFLAFFLSLRRVFGGSWKSTMLRGILPLAGLAAFGQLVTSYAWYLSLMTV